MNVLMVSTATDPSIHQSINPDRSAPCLESLIAQLPLDRPWRRGEPEAVDDAEDGRVRPDAEREREYGHGGEAGILQQLAEGVAEVVHRMNGLVDCWIIGAMEMGIIHPFIHQSMNPV